MTVEELEEVIDSQTTELKYLYEAFKQIQQVNRQVECSCVWTADGVCARCRIMKFIDEVY